MENMKIADYKIIEEYDLEKLQKEVNEAIADGWQPYGNLFTYVINNGIFFVQVMIKN
jgi:hypothetical protein